jgi:hypothetical protein
LLRCRKPDAPTQTLMNHAQRAALSAFMSLCLPQS